MKKTTLFVALSLMAASLMAAPVSEASALRVAVNFWNTYRPQETKPVASLQKHSFPDLQHLYVFANGDEGFVIVASDDRVRPVLGYSFDSPFPTRLHRELRYWLSGYERQIVYAAANEGAADYRWDLLLDSEVPPVPVSLTNVPMLCKTRWDQGAPFNALCPYDSVYRDRTVVGCVATAMAQIMKRWNHPSCGTGSHSYEYSYFGTLSADFGNTTYMWELMPNYITLVSLPEYEAALSTLSYHCGVAVDMMYGTHAVGGSGAYSSCGWWASACAENAFHRYFKYDSTLIHYRERYQYSDSEWLAMIDADLAAGRPMYYDGSDSTGGHAFVLDGSNLDTCYHFNWGWSGYGDGFYAMNNLAPGSGGAGGNATYSFNSDQGALFGIQPVPEVFDTIVLHDTICTNYTTYESHGYQLPVVNSDTNLRHLDTIFSLHLRVIGSNIVSYSSNQGLTSAISDFEYCPADGIELIECPFTRNKYHFVGWSTQRGGNTDSLYQPGQILHHQGNVTLYARWEKDSDVDVSDVEYDEAFTLWPNPTAGDVSIRLDAGQGVEVVVYDDLGRTMLREDRCGPVTKIPLSGLPDGVYTVRVSTENGVYNRRIIKQK